MSRVGPSHSSSRARSSTSAGWAQSSRCSGSRRTSGRGHERPTAAQARANSVSGSLSRPPRRRRRSCRRRAGREASRRRHRSPPARPGECVRRSRRHRHPLEPSHQRGVAPRQRPPPAVVGRPERDVVVDRARRAASSSIWGVTCGVSIPIWTTSTATRVGMGIDQALGEVVAALGRHGPPHGQIADPLRRRRRRRGRPPAASRQLAGPAAADAATSVSARARPRRSGRRRDRRCSAPSRVLTRPATGALATTRIAHQSSTFQKSWAARTVPRTEPGDLGAGALGAGVVGDVALGDPPPGAGSPSGAARPDSRTVGPCTSRVEQRGAPDHAHRGDVAGLEAGPAPQPGHRQRVAEPGVPRPHAASTGRRRPTARSARPVTDVRQERVSARPGRRSRRRP